MSDIINKILEKIYVYNKKNLTFDCSDCLNEKELLYDVGNLFMENGELKLREYDETKSNIAFIYDFKKKKYHQITNIEGGRNKRYKLFLDNETEQIIRTKDQGLEFELNSLLKSKYYNKK